MWYQATGAKMIGAVGKTQYMTNELAVLVLQPEDGAQDFNEL